MGLFGFFSMADNYEDRKVDRYEVKGGLIVDTAQVTDSEKDYETGICHPEYNDGKWVIVELYDTKAQAKAGHKKWVEKMTAKRLPPYLRDVSSAEVVSFCDALDEEGENWRDYPRQSKKGKEQ